MLQFAPSTIGGPGGQQEHSHAMTLQTACAGDMLTLTTPRL